MKRKPTIWWYIFLPITALIATIGLTLIVIEYVLRHLLVGVKKALRYEGPDWIDKHFFGRMFKEVETHCKHCRGSGVVMGSQGVGLYNCTKCTEKTDERLLSIGKAIHDTRLNHGLNLLEAAELMGIKTSHLSKIERGVIS